MRRFNDGVIKTNSNCIGCNRCISNCQVIGANVSVNSQDGTKMVVSSKKCIHCGACIGACLRGAREYTDDTEDFFKAVKSDRKISLLVDPLFFILYKDRIGNILGYLKSLGVNKIYNTGFGGEISLVAHVDYLKKHKDDKDRAFIGNTCSAVVNYFENYEPDLLNTIIPVQSPVVCTAIYVRNYLNDYNTLAYISPCPSKKDDMLGADGIISYNVCYSNLVDYIGDEKIDEYDAKIDLEPKNIGRLLSIDGHFKAMMELFFPRENTLVHHKGLDKNYFALIKQANAYEELRPYFVEISACNGGCSQGAGIKKGSFDVFSTNLYIRSIKEEYKDIIRGTKNCDKDFASFKKDFKEIDLKDFTVNYVSKYRQMPKVPESAYNEIFSSMHKDTEDKKHLDCGSCGYSTCKEMVEAIAYGYNKMENCIHYMNDELTIRYYTDSLTRIPNKEGFKLRAQRILDANPDNQYIIGAFSLNQLNLINDLHGFSAGDAVIRKSSEIIDQFTKDGGCCGRLGGGEFLVCFENTRENQDFLHRVGTFSFPETGISFPISFRVGLYIDEDKDETLESMINFASLARDKIEEDGVTTCLFYNAELKERLAAEAMVTSQMVAAINNREFVSFYQPQYSHRSKKLVGAETLCRWIKKDGSIISPGLFIPIFEKNGFIKTLDKYMWESAFETVTNWLNNGEKIVPISVNISRVSLDESDFVDTIVALHEKYPIDPKYLHFEITESAYSDRQDSVARKINALRERGFMVAMDDFGSGYSSLNVLKDMPLDILKLDMGFLRGKNQERGESIIRNVVAMVKELELDIISEGVESMEQAEFLKHVGCDIIQGYLYAKPMPEKEYLELLRKPLW